jgi:hypothetical protein
MYYFEDYSNQIFTGSYNCFPTTKIPMYKPCPPPVKPPVTPPVTPPVLPTCGSNIINITCGGNGGENKSSCCSKNSIITGPCITDSEIIYGSYKYILDKLPGLITVYKLDYNGCIINESKVIIFHTLGRLNRIYINNGKIIVEDSNSIEHIAIINSTTGELSF